MITKEKLDLLVNFDHDHVRFEQPTLTVAVMEAFTEFMATIGCHVETTPMDATGALVPFGKRMAFMAFSVDKEWEPVILHFAFSFFYKWAIQLIDISNEKSQNHQNFIDGFCDRYVVTCEVGETFKIMFPCVTDTPAHENAKETNH